MSNNTWAERLSGVLAKQGPEGLERHIRELCEAQKRAAGMVVPGGGERIRARVLERLDEVRTALIDLQSLPIPRDDLAGVGPLALVVDEAMVTIEDAGEPEPVDVPQVTQFDPDVEAAARKERVERRVEEARGELSDVAARKPKRKRKAARRDE